MHIFLIGNGDFMHKTDQDGLKYQKLYNWAHTLITSGVIKNMDKFPSETSLQKKFGYSRQTVRTSSSILAKSPVWNHSPSKASLVACSSL